MDNNIIEFNSNIVDLPIDLPKLPKLFILDFYPITIGMLDWLNPKRRNNDEKKD